jgi:DeoR/GlpR family transcriptional regulator of sugar metabolism
MKVAASVVEARRRSLAELLENHRYLPLAEVCARLRISPATARRDLHFLAEKKAITRTYGGALGAYDADFASFAERRGLDRDAKARIAESARQVIKRGSVCFFDGGTTVFSLAESLLREPVPGLVAVTNSLPVAEILGRGHEAHLIGGQFLQRQSLVLGEMARRAVAKWKFDLFFVGAEGVSAAGVWASDPEVAKFQRIVLRRTRRVLVCAHAAKIGFETGTLLAPWSKKITLVTDAARRDRKAHGLPLL